MNTHVFDVENNCKNSDNFFEKQVINTKNKLINKQLIVEKSFRFSILN
jgi:hypothetical protein